jgi:YHS domain-containing protein
MLWLSQNWIWILLGLGLLLMLRGGGCGMGRLPNRQHQRDGTNDFPSTIETRPRALFDPVSHHGFQTNGMTISTVHQGRAYYFESRENRDAFEANPGKYLKDARDLGEPVGWAATPIQHRHHHGC